LEFDEGNLLKLLEKPRVRILTWVAINNVKNIVAVSPRFPTWS